MAATSPAWFFVLVIVRDGDRFLVVQERKFGQTWYLPAGRVEVGEDFVAAAQRETLEEAGIHIEVNGIIRIEHTPNLNGERRIRIMFVASPVGSLAPKRVADEHSLGAAWVTLDELKTLPLRGEEVVGLFEHVARGGAVHPLSLLTYEGAPYA
ncbi:MAG TPA: NUDIX domain-containing protein [Polyangiaceae bacterium]|nr:NUDIX domain-containing protein [Polyangiaceae bacterium]